MQYLFFVRLSFGVVINWEKVRPKIGQGKCLHDVTLGRPTLGSCHVHDVGPVWDHSVLRTWRHKLWL